MSAKKNAKKSQAPPTGGDSGAKLTAAAAKTDVPEVLVSDEFHAPIAERSAVVKAGGWRVMRYTLLLAGLIAMAALFIWLTHEQPVN